MHKKNTILIFLLCLVAMPMLFSAYTIIEKKIIERSMEEKMEYANLQIIKVDAGSVIWLTKDKEILLNGKPFDIKSIARNGNKLTVSGLYDEHEEALKGELEAYHHSEDRTATSSNSMLFPFFTIWYLPNHLIEISIPFAVRSVQASQKYQDKICSSFKQVIVPPPRDC